MRTGTEPAQCYYRGRRIVSGRTCPGLRGFSNGPAVPSQDDGFMGVGGNSFRILQVAILITVSSIRF